MKKNRFRQMKWFIGLYGISIIALGSFHMLIQWLLHILA